MNSARSFLSDVSNIFNCVVFYSLLFGNLFVHFEFQSDNNIPKSTRNAVYGALTGTGVLGTLLILMMRKPPTDDNEAINEFLFTHIIIIYSMHYLYLS